MNFSTDRDLLAYEPELFSDVTWMGQTRLMVDDAFVSGGQLTSLSADFEATGVESGTVVLIGATPCEVIAREAGDTLTVSQPRARLSDPLIPCEPGGPFSAAVRTFALQAAQVHDGLLRLIGVEPDGPSTGDRLTEDAVGSSNVLARLEALGTLERIFSGAVALAGDNEVLIYKAGAYRRRFRHALAGASVWLDTNGDGHADERRRLGVIRFSRL